MSNHYQESYRPQFHFSPISNWMNDPNGMVYFEGEYHLFYQYYPNQNVWGPMHWGHAISRDLVVWEHLPIALFPDELGYIFSGSIVIDWNNTSGLGVKDQPPMIAIFTHHDQQRKEKGQKDFQYQSLAYSHDNGRTWIKYSENPVLPNSEYEDFRDPKIIWDANSKQWIMVLAVKDHTKIYGSPNLITWTHLDNFGHDIGAHGGLWECPDLFPMQVEQSIEKKWVLLQSLYPGAINGGSGTQYFIGEFDGTSFHADKDYPKGILNIDQISNALWLDYGKDNYAGVTWSDIPKLDGRRIFIGWMSNWDYAQKVPTNLWRGAMTIPRELVLRNTNNGFRLCSIPIEELKKLRKKTILNIDQGYFKNKLLFDYSSKAITTEFILKIDLNKLKLKEVFGFELTNGIGEKIQIGFDIDSNQFYIDRSSSRLEFEFSDQFGSKDFAPRFSNEAVLQLQVFVDTSSIELFADGGLTTITSTYFSSKPFNQLHWFSKNNLSIISFQLFELKSIW